jgi:hypothetical protein
MTHDNGGCAVREVPVRAHGRVAAERLAALEGVLRAHATLQDVFDWCRAQDPPTDFADVVVQDEFTHDVVVPVGGDLFAVYDTT